MGTHGQMYMRVSDFELANLVQSQFIVRVRSDEHVVVAVKDGSGVLLNHPCNHVGLLPKRNNDGNRFLRLRKQEPARLADARSIPTASEKRNEIDENVI